MGTALALVKSKWVDGDLIFYDSATPSQYILTIKHADGGVLVGGFTQSGANAFTTGIGAISINGQVTLADAINIALNVTTGTKIGTAVTQKLGFYNVTPVVQPAAAGQADQGAMTAVNPAAPTAYTAHAAGAVAVTSAAATDLDTTAAALKTLRDEVATYEIAISALIVDVTALDTLLTEIRTALVNTGIMKGAA